MLGQVTRQTPKGRVRVLAHGNCLDGACAAALVAEWMRRERVEADIDFVTYEALLPSPRDEDEELWMVDYAQGPLEIVRAGWATERVTILDHHKSQLDQFWATTLHPRSVLDTERSGAGIVWDVLFGGPRVELVAYIEDRDLWRWALPDSRVIAGWLKLLPLSAVWTWGAFTEWNDLVTWRKRMVLDIGEAIIAVRDLLVEQMLTQVIWVDIGGWSVPVVNASVYFSEVGEALLGAYPDVPFAAYYFDRGDGLRQWGARARDGFDLLPIVRELGGGGHPRAAGWTTAAGPLLPGGVA
jgi:hypothetical protein